MMHCLHKTPKLPQVTLFPHGLRGDRIGEESALMSFAGKRHKFNWIQSHTIIDHMQTPQTQTVFERSPGKDAVSQPEGRTTARTTVFTVTNSWLTDRTSRPALRS
ncbi:hypothetical protein ILYODFUR_000946 [Ilyodon furcidens]|uniref:Uncharacterized protein n=1 Tax=Ilyodon furcidens TaxID=33524 RepID=A0ABV0TR81_9TELE